MSLLRLRRTLLEQIGIHAEEQYPNECCGVLLGTAGVDGWTVVDVVRAANVALDSTRNRYTIAPAEIVRIMRQARQRSLEIAGFYHSHPDHPAIPSEFDRVHALPNFRYLITSVQQGKAADFRAWQLSDDRSRFEELTLRVDGV